MKEANTIPTSVHPHMMYANVHLRKVHDVNKNMTIKKKYIYKTILTYVSYVGMDLQTNHKYSNKI